GASCEGLREVACDEPRAASIQAANVLRAHPGPSNAVRECRSSSTRANVAPGGTGLRIERDDAVLLGPDLLRERARGVAVRLHLRFAEPHAPELRELRE